MESKERSNDVDQKNTRSGTKNEADQYFCVQCYQTIDSDRRAEHEDWHFAKDLEAEEQAGHTATPSQSLNGSHIPTPDPKQSANGKSGQPPSYAPPSYPPPKTAPRAAGPTRHHTNQVIEAAKIRARDEVRFFFRTPTGNDEDGLTVWQQQMQNALQNLQLQYQIYNSEIEPEHEADYYCNCPIHNYQRMKYHRYGVQDMWSNAVMYPG